MKTTRFRLLATIITLAAVTMAINTANAQRRSTTNSSNNERIEQNRAEVRENVRKKSGFRDEAIEKKETRHSVNNDREVKRYNSPSSTEREKERMSSPERSRENSKRSVVVPNKEGSVEKPDNKSEKRTESRSAAEHYEIKQPAPRGYEPERRTNNNTAYEKRYDDKRVSENSNRFAGNIYAERYNLNADDVRYKPNRDYRGSNKYWSDEYRGERRENKNTDRYYGNNFNTYRHWDRSWENYRWNHDSWRSYYGYYNPYSYKNHKYYYHHPYYGHVIRKFVYRPHIFIHNRTKYYCYDGFFFRHRPGIGYVLVEMPFGMVFEYLPDYYERVYINGFLYFRVGNLFFERTNIGFLLVHYPERYYAYNDGYIFGGFRF